MKNGWRYAPFTAEALEGMMKSEEIKIPLYQRGIVWEKSRKDAFIDSIKRGFPFGSILLYDKDGKGSNFELIDGLQRCNTIFEFINTPIAFFGEDDIDDAAIRGIYELLGISSQKEVVEQQIVDRIIFYLKDHCKTMKDVTEIQYINVAAYLSDQWPTLKNGGFDQFQKVSNLLEPSIKQFQEVCRTLKDATVPAIIFSGNESDLPDVFERINKQGSTLTKYQIFAATWQGVTFKISDPDLVKILDFVCGRYDVFTSGSVKIEDYDSITFKAKKEINAFDLCFGFGKLLKEKFPSLFGCNGKADQVDSLGFNIINACLCKKASQLGTLHSSIQNIGNDDAVQLFLKKIISCAADVERYLRVLTQYKGNTQDSHPLYHSENQITSIVASEFLLRYAKISNVDSKSGAVAVYDFAKDSDFWKKNKEQFIHTIRIYYVLDAVDSSWSGTGDKKLFSIITDPNYYLREIDKDHEFIPKLTQWFQDILNSRHEETHVATPKNADSILLNIVHLNTTTSGDQLDYKTFDIEHICPKNLLKRILLKYNASLPEEEKIRLPISSIANTCYLPTKLNRSKEDKTIYHAGLTAAELAIVEAKYTFTKSSDLDFLDVSSVLSPKEFKDKYYAFVNNRFSGRLLPIVCDFLFKTSAY